jgi:hypothetical protein
MACCPKCGDTGTVVVIVDGKGVFRPCPHCGGKPK